MKPTGQTAPTAASQNRPSAAELGPLKHDRLHLSLDEWAILGNQIVFQLSSDGTCRDVSCNIEQILGISHASLIGLPLEEIEWRSVPGEAGAGESRCRRLLELIHRDGWAAEFDLALSDQAGLPHAMRCQGISHFQHCSAESAILIAAYDVSSFLKPNSTNQQPTDRAPAEQLEDVGTRIAKEVHSLNNLFTAMHCQWDLAVGRDSSDQTENTRRLTTLFETAANQVHQISRVVADLQRNSVSNL